MILKSSPWQNTVRVVDLPRDPYFWESLHMLQAELRGAGNDKESKECHSFQTDGASWGSGPVRPQHCPQPLKGAIARHCSTQHHRVCTDSAESLWPGGASVLPSSGHPHGQQFCTNKIWPETSRVGAPYQPAPKSPREAFVTRTPGHKGPVTHLPLLTTGPQFVPAGVSSGHFLLGTALTPTFAQS